MKYESFDCLLMTWVSRLFSRLMVKWTGGTFGIRGKGYTVFSLFPWGRTEIIFIPSFVFIKYWLFDQCFSCWFCSKIFCLIIAFWWLSFILPPKYIITKSSNINPIKTKDQIRTNREFPIWKSHKSKPMKTPPEPRHVITRKSTSRMVSQRLLG